MFDLSLPSVSVALALAVALGVPLGASAAPDPTGIEQHAFDSLVAQSPDMSAADLLAKLASPGFLDRVDFEVTSADRYALVREKLSKWFGAEAGALMARNGFVAVQADQRFSLGSMYSYIYMNDLPVLITTDSILHALHTAYDDALAELESQVFSEVLFDSLLAGREHLAKAFPAAKGNAKRAIKDAELHLLVAMNLLRGAGGPADGYGGWDGEIKVFSRLGNDAAALALLKKVQLGALEQQPQTTLHGGSRAVDWSQFRPRGHYTNSPRLRQYFRGMMWLGRADTGLSLLTAPAGGSVDVTRERKLAAALTLALDATGGVDRLMEVSAMIDFLVGPADNLGLDPMRKALGRAGIGGFSDLEGKLKDAALKAELLTTGAAAQRIRSQQMLSFPSDPAKAQPPALFQLFGQRFVLDSFVMSQVVYDSIKFRGQKVKRLMPSGLDVWAALGNDEALRLLEPELKRKPYGSNLWAARRLVDSYPESMWRGTLYTLWLDALRELDERPTGLLPQAMKTQAWQRRMLRTQLGSWAQLRHDTILYAKQSYTVTVGCDYPAAYVEPYPAFYAKVGQFGRRAAQLISNAKLTVKGRDELPLLLQRQARFFTGFAKIATRLEGLANKELKGTPFTEAETLWLKKTIDKRGGGSGPPEYTGWYAELFYLSHPDTWSPTVADVHTDPNTGSFREVAVGDAQFLVVAADNDGDTGVFVGPTFSYYRFDQTGSRLTDEEWQRRIYDRKLPAAPAWTASFVAP